MGSLIYVAALLLYAIISIGIATAFTYIAKKPLYKLLWFGVGLFVCWNVVFWETIPTVAYREYMCQTWAGPQVYKTVQDVGGVINDVSIIIYLPYVFYVYPNGYAVFKENSKVIYTTKPSGQEDLRGHTPTYIRPPPYARYTITDKRFEKIQFMKAECTRYAIVDKETDELLGEFRDCSSGRGGNPFQGSISFYEATQNIPMRVDSCYGKKEDQRIQMRDFIVNVLQPKKEGE